MDDMKGVWPEERSPFRDLGPAFEPPGEEPGFISMCQGYGEPREAFDRRVAAETAKYRVKPVIFCVVWE